MEQQSLDQLLVQINKLFEEVAPNTVIQILEWGCYNYLVGLAISTLVFMFSFFAWRRVSKELKDNMATGDKETIEAFKWKTLMFSVSSIISFIVMIQTSYALAKIWVAPNLYVIEEVSRRF